MQRKPVVSSNVKSIGYDAERRVMEVEFRNLGVYEYEGVEPELYQRLIDAPSVGGFLHKHVRGRFPVRRL